MGNTAKEKKWDAIELGPIQNNFQAIYPTGQKKRERKKKLTHSFKKVSLILKKARKTLTLTRNSWIFNDTFYAM